MRCVSLRWFGIAVFALGGCAGGSASSPWSTVDAVDAAPDAAVWGGSAADVAEAPDIAVTVDAAPVIDTGPVAPDSSTDVSPLDTVAMPDVAATDVTEPTLPDTADVSEPPIDAGSPTEDISSPPEDIADDTTDAGPIPVEGTWDAPIVIVGFPFVHKGDTTVAPASEADFYAPCAPSIDESGGEVVFRVTLDVPGRLTATVDDLSGDGVDIDVHVLSGPSPDACVARDNLSVTTTLAAGEHFVAVDTYRNASGQALAGPYTLVVAFEPGATEAACLVPLAECTSGDAPTPSGVPAEAPGAGGCPPGMVHVGAFCIDRYEATLVEVLPGGGLAPFSPYQNPGTTKVRALSVAGAVPQAYIDQVRAAAACAEAGKRLCTDTEWLRACQGPATLTFPYGPLRWPKFCNDSRHCHPAVQAFGTTASWIWSALGDSCIDQQPYSLAEAGRYEACETAEGVLDMMGNLHEWTADPDGTFRGGFYADTKINGDGCLYKTTAHNVYHWDYSTGFRCCADL